MGRIVLKFSEMTRLNETKLFECGEDSFEIYVKFYWQPVKAVQIRSVEWI